MQRRPFFGLLACAALPPAATQGAAVVEVQIRDMQFLPAELSVSIGTAVRWTNMEKRTSHSVLFEDQPESERLLPGEHWERRFEHAGDYPYVCGPHPEMRARVQVR
jgi:plastocyanin